MVVRRFMNRVVHQGLDELAVHMSRLRPLHPLDLRLGPLRGDPARVVRGVPGAGPLDIPLERRVTHLSLPSPVKGAAPPNDILHLHIFPPRRDPQGVVVFSPFWMIPSPWALGTYLRLASSLGLYSVLYTPPDHMRRTPRGYFSGERLLGWDFGHMEQMMQLAVAELVAVTSGLQAHGKPVYLVGMSLGGLFAAMASVAGAPLAGLALVTPAADMQVSMSRTAIGRRYRSLLERRGLRVPSEELLAELGAPFRATAFDRPLATDRIFLAHGRHDAVVPLAVATSLAGRWAVPLREYECGHMSLLFLDRALRRDLRGFLEKRLAEDTKAPRVVSPAHGNRAGGRV